MTWYFYPCIVSLDIYEDIKYTILKIEYENSIINFSSMENIEGEWKWTKDDRLDKNSYCHLVKNYQFKFLEWIKKKKREKEKKSS